MGEEIFRYTTLAGVTTTKHNLVVFRYALLLKSVQFEFLKQVIIYLFCKIQILQILATEEIQF